MQDSSSDSDYMDINQGLMDPNCDQRLQVDPQKIKQFPHNCIGLLLSRYIKDAQTISKGTAFLISSNLILSVAHNIYNINRNMKIELIPQYFYPGMSNDKNQYVEIQQFRVNKQYSQAYFSQSKDLGPRTHDYALLKLKKSIKLQEYFNLCYNYKENAIPIHFYGYPGQIIKKNQKKQFVGHQYGMFGQSQFAEDGLLYYKLDSTPGQSGSPILSKHKGKMMVVCLHKGETKKKDQNKQKSEKFNYGVLLTETMIADLYQWQQEMKGDSFIAINIETDKQFSNSLNSVKINSQNKPIYQSQKTPLKSPARYTESPKIQQQSKKEKSIQKKAKIVIVSSTNVLSNMLSKNVIPSYLSPLIYKQKQQQIQKNKKQFFSNSFSRQLNTKKQQIKQSKNIKIQIQLNPSYFQWDETTPDAKQFSIKRSIVEKCKFTDGNRYMLTGLQPIPKEVSIFIFKLQQYGNKNPISFGVLSETNKRQSYGQWIGNFGSVSLWVSESGGWIKTQNVMKFSYNIGLLVRAGRTIMMKINREVGQISFVIPSNSNKEWVCSFPQSLKDKQIYPFVSMQRKGDIIQMIK